MDTPKMRLSKAIRVGIEQFSKQARGMFFSIGIPRKSDEACALGCAIYATYGSADESLIHDLLADYPELLDHDEFPAPRGMELKIRMCDNLRDIIITLNDDCHWSREQIADWLESEGL